MAKQVSHRTQSNCLFRFVSDCLRPDLPRRMPSCAAPSMTLRAASGGCLRQSLTAPARDGLPAGRERTESARPRARPPLEQGHLPAQGDRSMALGCEAPGEKSRLARPAPVSPSGPVPRRARPPPTTGLRAVSTAPPGGRIATGIGLESGAFFSPKAGRTAAGNRSCRRRKQKGHSILRWLPARVNPRRSTHAIDRKRVDARFAGEARTAVHLGGTGAALRCLAVPADGKVRREMALDVMQRIEDHHAGGDGLFFADLVAW